MSEDELNEVEDEEFGEFMDSVESRGVYLSGPIRCVDDNGIGWREELIEDYPEFDFNNPLDNYTPEEHDILNDPADFDGDAEKKQVLPSEYVLEDKIMINESDAVFLGLPEEIARGSMMEAMYAVMKNIPVFVWVIDGQQESGWIYHNAEFMDEDRTKVVAEMRAELNGENNE